MEEIKNVGELWDVNSNDVLEQINLIHLNTLNRLAITLTQKKQLDEAYSKVSTELIGLRKYLKTAHPDEFEKLYPDETKDDEEKNKKGEN